MYRVSPFTYIVSSVLSTGLAETDIVCSDIEELHLSPPLQNQTCQEFLGQYAQFTHGRILNPEATSNCRYCPAARTDDFLATISVRFDERWRNIGILFAYVGFNIVAGIFLYWLARVPKRSRVKEKKA